MNQSENYYLKIVTENEVAAAMGFINEAKAFLKSQGVDQWQQGYPNQAVIEQDIAEQKGYFLMDGDEPLAYMCVDFNGEPAYNDLNGNWLSDLPYGVVHRLAIGSKRRGCGLASISFQLAEKLILEHGFKSFRVDTDDDNKIMKHLLDKNGFTYCGTIWFDYSTKIAYEKLL